MDSSSPPPCYPPTVSVLLGSTIFASREELRARSFESVCVGVSGSVSGSGQRVAARVGGSRERERDATRVPSSRTPLTLSRTRTANRVPPTNTLPLSLTLAAIRLPAPLGLRPSGGDVSSVVHPNPDQGFL
jgi:hypothetical protein